MLRKPVRSPIQIQKSPTLDLSSLSPLVSLIAELNKLKDDLTKTVAEAKTTVAAPSEQPGTPSLIDVAKGFNQITVLSDQLTQLKDTFTQKLSEVETSHIATLDAVKNDVASQFYDHTKSLLGEISSHISAHVEDVTQKLDALHMRVGMAADSLTSVATTKDALMENLRSIIRDGEDGKDAILTSEMLWAMIDKLPKGKRLKMDHVDGLDQTLSVIRNLAARGGVRGGGDTVAAGTGITITTTNGVKTIAAGTGTFVRDEVPAGSGTAFTLAHTPVSNSLQLFRGGAKQRSGAGNDFTISGTAITLASALVTGEVLTADYSYT